MEKKKQEMRGVYQLSSGAEARREFLILALRELGPTANVDVVGHSRRAAERLILDAFPQGAFGCRPTTLRRLALDVCAMHGSVPHVVAAPVQISLMRNVIAQLDDGALLHLAALRNKPGLAPALLDTIIELRGAGLRSDAAVPAPLPAVAAAFEMELSARGLADAVSVFETATHALAHSAQASGLAGRHLVVLDVAFDSAVERQFFAALAARAHSCHLSAPWADPATLTWFDKCALAPTAAPYEGNRASQTLARRLFDEDAAVAAPKAGLTLRSLPSEARECVEIARECLRRASTGLPFERMAVLLRNPDAYLPQLRDAFRRAQVPFLSARPLRDPFPAGRAFLTLLQCARESLSAARFAEYLSLGEVPDAALFDAEGGGMPEPALRARLREDSVFTEHEFFTRGCSVTRRKASPMALRAWENYLRDARVIEGAERFQRRLVALMDQHTLSGRCDLAGPTSLKRLTEVAWPIIEHLAGFPAQASLTIWLSVLAQLARVALAEPDEVLSVLAELEPAGAALTLSLCDIQRLLEPSLTTHERTTAVSAASAVFVGSPDDARGLVFDVVFVPGLAERMFPQKLREDPLLLDPVREGLAASLAIASSRADAERLALRLAVGASTQLIFASYPRMDESSGRPRTPSFYALELWRAAYGSLDGLAEASLGAPVWDSAVDTDDVSRLGFPAPNDPQRAIDNAEHDLALLSKVLFGGATETDGMGRYLLSANAHLSRALKSRAHRWNVRKLTYADGLVDLSAVGKEALKPHLLSERSYSPTALQNFAACPYRFVLQAIWRLRAREVPARAEDFNPLQRGSFVHEVQFQLLLALRERGALPLTPAKLEEAFTLLEQVTAARAAAYAEELYPMFIRVWDDTLAQIRADLRGWLRAIAGDRTWKPKYFELAFGLSDEAARDPLSSDAPLAVGPGMLLRGSIDLVEEGPNGELRATDYKTGRVRAEDGDVIAGGEILQPVFYSLALHALLPNAKVAGARLFYCTYQGAFRSVDFGFDDHARAAAKTLIDTVGGLLEAGTLPAYPMPDACDYCDYARVCGPYEVARAKRKKSEALIPLTRLRGLP